MPPTCTMVLDVLTEVQTSGGTVTVVAQAADPPSYGAYHPTPTGGAQM